MKNNTDGMTHEEKICWMADNIRAGNKFQLQYIEDGDNWFDWGADGRVNDKYTCRLKPAMERPNLIAALKDKKPLKMKVTPEESKEIQRTCFENGVDWRRGLKEIKSLSGPFLYIWETEDNGYHITHNDNDVGFEFDDDPEYILSTDTIISNEPEYVEWTFETAPEIIKVKGRKTGHETLLKLHWYRGSWVYEEADGHYSLNDVFKIFVQLDGTPCGKKKESDFPVHVGGEIKIAQDCKQCKHYRDGSQQPKQECRECRPVPPFVSYYDRGFASNFELKVK